MILYLTLNYNRITAALKALIVTTLDDKYCDMFHKNPSPNFSSEQIEQVPVVYML